MVITTKAIVLSRIKYSDTSIIVKVFTEAQGLKTLIAKNARKSKRGTANYYQPGSILETSYYHKETSNIGTIRSSSFIIPNNLIGDIAKSSIAMFLSELIIRYIREEAPNQELYTFIRKNLVSLMLDQDNLSIITFPQKFVAELIVVLGIQPQLSKGGHLNFCFIEGSFLPEYLCKKPVDKMKSEMLFHFFKNQTIPIEKVARKILLDLLLEYMDTQLSRSGKIKTLEVLSELSS